MKNTWTNLAGPVLPVLLLAWMAQPLLAGPGWIPHQGRLVLNGTNYHGTGYFKFALVDGGQNVNRTATGKAFVVSGQVRSVAIIDPGSGYEDPPRISIVDVRGRGATAEAFIADGEVVDIRVLSAGSGYGTTTRVTFEPPPVRIQHVTFWSHDGTSVDGGEPTGGFRVIVDQGLYFTALGDTSLPGMNRALSPDVFAGMNDLHLRLWFSPSNAPGSFEQLQPDQPLGSVGHALAADQAALAATVAAGAITADQLADGSVTAAKISAPGSEKIPVSDGRGGIAWMTIGEFLLSQNYNPPLPGIVENEASLEISGIFVDVVQIVNGPGIEIERVPSTLTESGLNTEFALVFDYAGPNTNDLQLWFDQLQAGTDPPRSGSIIVNKNDGSESFRWNFLEYELTSIGSGQGRAGKNRYTLTHALAPDRLLAVRLEGVWQQTIDDNQGVDNKIEITGVIFDVYPVVEDDPASKTLTLTFDYSEAGDIWAWVAQIATGGTTMHGHKAVSVIFQRNDGMEIGRNDYFGCFPIRYQHFTGFGQDTKAKARLVVSYDDAQNASGSSLPLYAPPVIQYAPGTNNLELPFDPLENRALMEISGVMAAESTTPPDQLPVILSGPGFEIERLPGFDGTGNPDDQSGLNREMPLIFEVGAPFLAPLEVWKSEYDALLPVVRDNKSGSINVLNSASVETYRWNFFEMAPFSIEPQPSGRSRVILLNAASPDNEVFYRYLGTAWGDNLQNNPATDTEVEISGITTVFAEVEVDTSNRTVTLTYDFGEGGSVNVWAADVAVQGTSFLGKNAMIIHSATPMNYLGCFPVLFQHFTGFEQNIKGRARVVLSYDIAQPVL